MIPRPDQKPISYPSIMPDQKHTLCIEIILHIENAWKEDALNWCKGQAPMQREYMVMEVHSTQVDPSWSSLTKYVQNRRLASIPT